MPPSPMPSVIGLPSTSSVSEVLKPFLDADAEDTTIEQSRNKWKEICLAALSYGTDYAVPTLRTHAAESKLKLKTRASKTLAFFMDVMAKFDADLASSQEKRQKMQEQEAGNKLYVQQIDPVRLLLADSLWMVGQLLVPPEITSTSTSHAAKSTPGSGSGQDSSRTTSDAIEGNKSTSRTVDAARANKSTSRDTEEERSSSMRSEEDEELREESLSAYTYILQGLSGMKVDVPVPSGATPTLRSSSTVPTLPPPMMQMLLDTYLLGKASIVPYDAFIKRYRKYQTNILYRQKRFNLLAEESEGWAKVLTLLSSLPILENDTTAAVLEQLRGYIGAFDLDPNRLLSILLDVLELELDRTLKEIASEIPSTSVQSGNKESPVSNRSLTILLELIRHFKVSALPHLLGFQLEYLLAPVSSSTSSGVENGSKDSKATESATAANSGSGDIHIDKPNPVPKSFYNLCAFLVAHAVVSLEELYPYFAPRADSNKRKGDTSKTTTPPANATEASSSSLSTPVLLGEWTKAKQKHRAEELRSWGIVSLNASNPSTTEGNAKGEPTEQTSLDAVEEQCSICHVLTLLECLLTFGAWNSFMLLVELSRLPPPPPLSLSSASDLQRRPETENACRPTDVDVILLRPSIGTAICEMLHSVVDPWYRNSSMDPPLLWSHTAENSLASAGSFGGLIGKRTLKVDACRGYIVRRCEQIIPVEARIKNTTITEGEEDLLIDIIFEPAMMLASSQETIVDAALYVKLCRLSRSLLARSIHGGQEEQSCNPSTATLSPRSKIIVQRYLLPALSLYPANPQLCYDLWSCLKLLPFTMRYSLYDAWAFGPRSPRRSDGSSFLLERNAISRSALNGNGCLASDKTLWAVRTEVTSGKETRSVLKRLAKETIGEQGRRFAKVSCTSPIVAFSILIQQMQAYDNMIDLMVDSFRLCSDLSRDVLVYCLLQNLAGVDGGKLDFATTQLLTSIETFTGTLYRTFPHLQIGGVLDLLLNRLVTPGPVSSVSLSGLGVIRSLLTTAGGLELVGGEGGAVSGQQLEGRAGSQLLRRETVSFGVVDRVNPVASASLLNILLSSEKAGETNNIGIAMLIRMAQLRLKVLFDPELKLKDVTQLGKAYDSIQSTMLLLLEFLSTPRDWKHGREAEELVETYASNIPPLTMLLDRDSGYGIDAAVAWALCRPCIRAALMAEEQVLEKWEQEEAERVERGESNDASGTNTEDDAGIPMPYRQWLPSSPAIYDVCQTLIPSSLRSAISPTLYCTFWSLDLFDLYVPKQRYNAEINRLNKEEERLIALKQRKVAPSESHPFSAKDAAELQRVTTNASRLKEDHIKQVDHYKFVKTKKFEAEMGSFFVVPPIDVFDEGVSMDVDLNCSGNSARAFLTLCVFPRALCSPDGAFYCAKFILRLHSMNTPKFYTLQFFDYLLKATVGALLYVTEEEAQNLGILLEYIWSVLVEWRYGNSDSTETEKVYEREVMSKQGSILDDVSEPVTFSKYKEIYTRWHDALGKAFLGCLEAKSKGVDDRFTNLRVRSAINILTRLVRIYPTRPGVGDMLFKRLKPLQEDESRQDTKAMANAYLAQLTKAMLDGCWKEQTASQIRDREEQEQARAVERKKRSEQTQMEMAADNARIEKKITEGRERGRGGDPSRYGRERDKASDRRKVEDKVVRSPIHPETNPFNTPGEGQDRDKVPDRDRDREREKEREYRDRDRSDRGRSVEASNESERRVVGSRSGRAAPSWQAPSTQSAGLDGRWQGSASGGPPSGKNDRESGNKRGRSPPDTNVGPMDKKAKNDDDRGRGQGQLRQGRHGERGDSGRRY